MAQNSEPPPTSTKAARDDSLSPVIGSLYYTVDEIAAMWKLSHDSVRRLFRNEPGVLVISPRNRKGKRSYTTLRIPSSVVERVHRRLSLVKILTK